MKNNILTTVVGLVLLLTTTYNTSAQNYNNTQVAHVNDCIKRTMSLNVLIAKDSLGNACQTSGALMQAVDSLNAHLAPICLQFKVCKITFVDNHKFNWFMDDRQKGEREDFRNLYCEDSVINVLYVGLYFSNQSASNAAAGPGSDGADDFSYLSLPPLTKKKKPLIVLGAGKDPRFLTKFLLKTMGMQATGSTTELVDGSNCETLGAGDRICDTPADPSGAQEGPPPTTYPNCIYTGVNGSFPVDANGAVYAPMLGNILSDHGMPCTAQAPKALTAGQYNKIIKLYYGDQTNVITSWKRYK